MLVNSLKIFTYSISVGYHFRICNFQQVNFLHVRVPNIFLWNKIEFKWNLYRYHWVLYNGKWAVVRISWQYVSAWWLLCTIQLSCLSVPHKGNSRNASCAINFDIYVFVAQIDDSAHFPVMQSFLNIQFGYFGKYI